MTFDRWIALLILLVCLVYGYAAYTYPLLPFERNMAFLPNTLPMALSVLGALVALFIVLVPTARDSGSTDISLDDLKHFKLGQTAALIGAMIAYALLLRPLGFLVATTLFIAVCSCVLGERKFHVLVPIAILASVGVWFLVQDLLGIFFATMARFRVRPVAARGDGN